MASTLGGTGGSLIQLQPNHAYGFKGDVKDNISFLDEHFVIYPVGSNLVMYNVDQKSQKFLQGAEKREGMTAMTVSPSRRYVAIAERGDRPTVTICDLQSNRKKKVLTNPDALSNQYVSMAFSSDSKFLVTQGGSPDWILTFWLWEKSKVLASIKSSNQHNAQVHEVRFNPQDNTQLCVVGNGIFKLYRFSEGNLKQFAFQKLEPQSYLCQSWISEERVLVGTDTSKLLLFESGELKQEIAATHGDDEACFCIESVVCYSKGFICAGERGVVLLYEKTEEKEGYKKSKEFVVDNGAGTIKALAINPSEESMICSTDTNQLYILTLSNTELLHSDEISFDLLSSSFHHSAVTGLDLCYRKPIAATCALDKSIRVWNYNDNSLELVNYFDEEAHSISLHPSGHYAIVGLNDRLCLVNLLIDDIRPCREFPIRGCKECQFSTGGQYFAVVNGNIVQIYSTYTFENIGNLKGHIGKIRSLCWNHDDSRLYTCSMDGSIIEWKTSNFTTEFSDSNEDLNYSSICLSGDGKSAFLATNDNTLKELCEGHFVREAVMDCCATQITLTKSNRVLFMGTDTGTIRCIKLPLTQPLQYSEVIAHSGAVTRLRLTVDDMTLFSTGEDGCVYNFRIFDKEARGVKRDKDVTWAEEILITRSDLEEKNAVMQELKGRVEILKMENEYQLRLKDINYNEKIKELTDKFLQEMEALKIQNSVLTNDKEKEIGRHQDLIVEESDKFSKEMNTIESINKQKLQTEVDKYNDLQQRCFKVQEDFERQLKETEASKEQALVELTEYYEQKYDEKVEELDNASKSKQVLIEEYLESISLIEDDANRETLEMKTKYERRFKEERDAGFKLKAENAQMRKRFNSLQREVEKHKGDIQKMFNEQKKLHSVIKSLEKDIAGLRKEIQERDETIQDKEKRIYDLKKKNQELEKFKFVLDYKIKELKKQIEPRENDIRGMKEQIVEMDRELERYYKQNTNLELAITDLKLKLKAAEKDLECEKEKLSTNETTTRKMRIELHDALQSAKTPADLKDKVKDLYATHVRDFNPQKAAVERDSQFEYNRQREYLERNVASLKYKLQKGIKLHKGDHQKIMRENTGLIKEINDLRREIKTCKKRVNDLNLTIQGDEVEEQRPIAPTKAGGSAGFSHQENINVVHTQRAEIGNLRLLIQEMEQGYSGGHMQKGNTGDIIAFDDNGRPLSASKLPPIEKGKSDTDEVIVSDAPAEEGEATPAEEGEAAPAEEGEAAPAEEGEAAPAEEGEAAPAEEGKAAPAAPAEEGEAAPAEEGEAAPAEEGETAPAEEGEVAPAEEGEAASAEEGPDAPAEE
eukprot:Nk52_evm28s266 gene=Nk52_evmTU28s266